MNKIALCVRGESSGNVLSWLNFLLLFKCPVDIFTDTPCTELNYISPIIYYVEDFSYSIRELESLNDEYDYIVFIDGSVSLSYSPKAKLIELRKDDIATFDNKIFPENVNHALVPISRSISEKIYYCRSLTFHTIYNFKRFDKIYYLRDGRKSREVIFKDNNDTMFYFFIKRLGFYNVEQPGIKL